MRVGVFFTVVVCVLSLISIQIGRAQNASFSDLWCQYGGECNQRAKPTPAPAAPPVGAAKPTIHKEIRPETVHKPAQVPKPQAVRPAPKPAPKVVKAKPDRITTPLIKRNASLAKSDGIVFGRYYALVIGNNGYDHLPKLRTAQNDAKAVGQLLKSNYGFSVNYLMDAGRDQIISTLDEYRKILKKEDNFLIYYAGHGWLDQESERGYWLPVDAKETTRARWVSNADITDTLKALKAKHVMVVADSCYSGTLTRTVEGELTRGIKLVDQSNSYLETLVGRKSRTVLASGSLEPVSDGGGGKHSVFAHAFLKSLKDNKSMIDGTQLFGEIRQQVMLNSRQTPQYSNIRFAGHDVGGDFVFLKRR